MQAFHSDLSTFVLFCLGFCFLCFNQTIQHQDPLPCTCRDDDPNSWSQRDDAFDRGAPGGRVAQNMAMSASHLVQPAAN